MKKQSLFLALVMCALLILPVFGETADTFTSASTTSSYAQFALEGDDLVQALASITGFYTVSTTNPDGSPNVAFFIYGAKEHEGKLYLLLGLAENQSKQNILTDKQGVAMYAANPGTAEGDKPFAVAGARMRFVLVEDQALITELKAGSERPALFVEVVELLPLG